jgi:hypothetical protein
MQKPGDILAPQELQKQIREVLRTQGFRLENGKLLPPVALAKDDVRLLHRTSVEHRIGRARAGLVRHEPALLRRIASGHEVDPCSISPRLIEVKSGSEDERLFRYACLHWSIPVSSGYGRRLRFLVLDESNEKLIGLIGLGDPVFNLGPRDQWIGWNLDGRDQRLRNVMDAFVLGAVPPYSLLLCGKLVALLATSDTVRDAFKRKYGGQESRISRREHDGRLALITTASALGRSSVYNRLRLHERLAFESVGFTAGSGEFHFSNGLYGAISAYAKVHCAPTWRKERWGSGFRNKREIVRKCLAELGLSADWSYHGVNREVFVAPLASNTQAFLRGEHRRLHWFKLPAKEIVSYFQERWLLPRATWDDRYKSWDRDEWLLWRNNG